MTSWQRTLGVFARAFLALAPAAGLSSCLYGPGPYGYEPGYQSSYSSYGAAEPYIAPSGYLPAGGFLGSSSYPYSYGRSSRYRPSYSSPALCSRCGRNPCVCSRSNAYPSPRGHGYGYGYGGYDGRHDDHDKSKTPDLVHHPGTYKVVGGSTGGKEKPQGYHPPSWYKSRGYDVDKLKLRSEDGKSYSGGSSKSSSKSKKK